MRTREEQVYWLVAAHSKEKKAILQALYRSGGRQSITDVPVQGTFWSEERLIQGGLVLEQLENLGGRMITLWDEEYPDVLRVALKTSAPLVLYAIGDVTLLRRSKKVAFAGSRNACQEAIALSRKIAEAFVRVGYTIVTGFAPGIDRNVTQAALHSGGATIGVLPQGLIRKETQSLIRQFWRFISNGQLLLVSEVHPYAPWHAQYAMMRNRIIAGLADQLVVGQSSVKVSESKGKKRFSGTWHCAEVARKIGKPVYVLDLPIAGNQALIREGIAVPWSDALLPR